MSFSTRIYVASRDNSDIFASHYAVPRASTPSPPTAFVASMAGARPHVHAVEYAKASEEGGKTQFKLKKKVKLARPSVTSDGAGVDEKIQRAEVRTRLQIYDPGTLTFSFAFSFLRALARRIGSLMNMSWERRANP